jgi:predicted porin
LILDYRLQVIDYDSFPLDSTSHIILIGFEEGLTPQLKVTARAGETFRSYVDAGDTMNPNINATVTYMGAHNSSLSWVNSYSIEEPNSTFARSRKTFRTGLKASYDVSDRITTTAAAYYHHDENQVFSSVTGTSGTFPSDSFDISLRLHYALRSGFSVDLAIQHSEVSSAMAVRNYSRNQYSAGVTYRY